MFKLTKLMTLLLCAEMWEKIARGDTTSTYMAKYNACLHVLHQHNMDSADMPKLECFCCEYTNDAGLVNCSRCPMLSIWGNKLPYACEQSGSPYKAWSACEYGSSDRKKFAAVIATGARKLYERERHKSMKRLSW